MGTSPASILGADFNTDGYNDLAVANSYSDNITILINNGGRYSSGMYFYRLTAGKELFIKKAILIKWTESYSAKYYCDKALATHRNSPEDYHRVKILTIMNLVIILISYSFLGLFNNNVS